VLVAATLSIVLPACGGQEDDASAGAAQAEEIASCSEDAGFDPTVSELADVDATAVDLTTETATIVLHVFDSEVDAAGYEPSSGLDAEQDGSVVILGGAIPPEELARIKDCVAST